MHIRVRHVSPPRTISCFMLTACVCCASIPSTVAPEPSRMCCTASRARTCSAVSADGRPITKAGLATSVLSLRADR